MSKTKDMRESFSDIIIRWWRAQSSLSSEVCHKICGDLIVDEIYNCVTELNSLTATPLIPELNVAYLRNLLIQ